MYATLIVISIPDGGNKRCTGIQESLKYLHEQGVSQQAFIIRKSIENLQKQYCQNWHVMCKNMHYKLMI